jgi:hypothetical protein
VAENQLDSVGVNAAFGQRRTSAVLQTVNVAHGVGDGRRAPSHSHPGRKFAVVGKQSIDLPPKSKRALMPYQDFTFPVCAFTEFVDVSFCGNGSPICLASVVTTSEVTVDITRRVSNALCAVLIEQTCPFVRWARRTIPSTLRLRHRRFRNGAKKKLCRSKS